MTDLVERLRRWCHDVYAESAQDLMDEAADEIDRLRDTIRRLAEQDALNAEENELKELKSVVNQFLDAIYEVPFRAIDCNQQLVENLWKRLADAVNDANSDVKKTLQ